MNSSAEVVCVDGLDRVETVIVRRMGTGRLIGVNASAIQVFGIVDDASSLARRMETLPAS